MVSSNIYEPVDTPELRKMQERTFVEETAEVIQEVVSS